MDPFARSQPILFGAVFLVWVTASFVSNRRFLYLTGFLLPLTMPRLEVGIGLEWAKVLGPASFILLAFRPRRSQVPRPPGMGAFMAYSVAVTVVWMVVEYTILHRYLAAAAMGLGIGQSYYKMPVQLVSFLCQLSLVYVVPSRAQTRDEALAAVRGFAAGALFSVLFGVALYVATGQGMLGTRGMGVVAVEGLDIARIGGLSGEPKFLGVLLGVLIMWELSQALFGAPRYPVLITAIVGLGLTLSTSAWAGAFVAGASLFWMSLRHGLRVRWRVWSMLTVGTLLVASMGSLTASIFSKRFSDRIFGERSELSRQKDSYLLDAYGDTPVHAIYGFGLGGGDLAVIPYLTPEERAYQRTPTPGVTAARILGDLGIVGLTMLLAMAWKWSKGLMARGERAAGAFAVAGIVAVLFGSLLAMSAYMLVAGAAIAASRLPSKQAKGLAASTRARTAPGGLAPLGPVRS